MDFNQVQRRFIDSRGLFLQFDGLLCPPKNISGISNVAFGLQDFDWTKYPLYKFYGINIIPFSNGERIQVSLSSDNGATYANSNYQYSSTVTTNAAVVSADCSAANSQFELGTIATSNVVLNGGVSFTFEIRTPWSLINNKHCEWRGKAAESVGGTITTFYGNGICQDTSPNVSTAAVNNIKFSITSNVIASGIILAVGSRNL